MSWFTHVDEFRIFRHCLGLMVEVIPSELVLSYAGYLVSQGEVNFFGASLSISLL